jgi:putative flippase GtrA
MSSLTRIRAAAETPISAPAVEIVVPVRDESRVLGASVRRLHEYLADSFPFPARVTIADNGSTDGTWEIAERLADELELVEAVRIDLPGRGRALSTVWSHSDAAVLAYMDVDLSTDLAALLPLVAPLLSGHSDLAIGSRLTRGARVVRGPKRELISRAYNALLHAVLGVRFSDAQCGFKAIRADRACLLLPLVRDPAWFFDTELLVLAERMGLRIHEVPVDWVDDADSRVAIVPTAAADLRGVARLARDLARGRIPLARELGPAAAPSFNSQVLRFAAIGVASTAAYALLYLALRPLLAAQPANALALLVTAVANTAANRRFTFAVRGRAGVARHQTQGLAVFALALGLTSGSIALLHALAPAVPRPVELGALTAANLAATVLRFVLLRTWVFRARRTPPPIAAMEEPR